MNEHELVSKLKELAHELGKVPNKHEFMASGVSDSAIRKVGGFTVITQMAGFETYTGKKREFKADKDVFKVELKAVVENYKHDEKKLPNFPKILVLGDIHFPFHSKTALEKVYEFCGYFKPDYIVQMGDLFDFLAHSKFPRSHNTYSPKEEERIAREEAEKMWAKLREIAPNAELFQLIGNHDLRPLKRTLETAPQIEHWAQKYWDELMTFEGVTTIYDNRQELEIGGILFTHGFLGKEGAHRDYYLKSTVVGHLHKLWVQYKRVHGGQIFDACCGFLGEPESKALTYNNSKLANYQQGFLAIDEFGPRAVHL